MHLGQMRTGCRSFSVITSFPRRSTPLRGGTPPFAALLSVFCSLLHKYSHLTHGYSLLPSSVSSTNILSTPPPSSELSSASPPRQHSLYSTPQPLTLFLLSVSISTSIEAMSISSASGGTLFKWNFQPSSHRPAGRTPSRRHSMSSVRAATMTGSESDDARRQKAFSVRHSAAASAASRPHPPHISNPDYMTFGSVSAFTKGLPHNASTGLLLHKRDFQQFMSALESGSSGDIRRLPLGPDDYFHRELRGWQGITSGLSYDLQGPDPQALTMPPAPSLNGAELALEMSELYWMAILRDVPFSTFHKSAKVRKAIYSMNKQPWVKHGRKLLEMDKDEDSSTTSEGETSSWSSMEHYDRCRRRRSSSSRRGSRSRSRSQSNRGSGNLGRIDEHERRRLRGPFFPQTVFRGVTLGDNVGPYISQFLLMGTPGADGVSLLSEGFVQYGAVRIDQRVRVALPRVDYMTSWKPYIDVQNGIDVSGRALFVNSSHCRRAHKDREEYRFITTPRDLCTYVHYDVSYQPYYIAALILLGLKAPFDKGLPFQRPDAQDKQAGFVTFGAPHIVGLVAEVASRALKAATFQKYHVHLRIRPEAVGGHVDRYNTALRGHDEKLRSQFMFIHELYSALNSDDLLHTVADHNANVNKWARDSNIKEVHGGQRLSQKHDRTALLSQAYPEGSPMHPSYAAGHATVAGACTTVLKAFFDTDWLLPRAFVPSEDGSCLNEWTAQTRDRKGRKLPCRLSVEGELNKLCSNISIGRNWAGVHYFSDYLESIALGEQVAIQLLQEQKGTFWEKDKMSMTVPKFDGTVVKI